MRPCTECGHEAVLIDSAGAAFCGPCADRRHLPLSLGSLATALWRPTKSSQICPHCGCTDATARETDHVGCPLCYEALPDALAGHFGIRNGSNG